MGEHKTNPAYVPRNRVTKEYAESYYWWNQFLQARLDAIDALLQLGKSKEEIQQSLNFSDDDHLNRIIIMNKLEG